MDQVWKEKKSLERAAIELFIAIYNANNERQYRLLYQQERPDAVLEDKLLRSKLGMEITHLFYDAEEAKMLLGRSMQSIHDPESLENLIAGLNHLIAVKEEKRNGYSKAYPVSLLIRNVSPVFGMSDILGIRDRIVRPKAEFEDVWLLSRDAANEWLLLNLEKLTEWKDR